MVLQNLDENPNRWVLNPNIIISLPVLRFDVIVGIYSHRTIAYITNPREKVTIDITNFRNMPKNQVAYLCANSHVERD